MVGLMGVLVFDRVRITEKAPFFQGERAVVAYVGMGGISVYLSDHAIDSCIPLMDGEYELVEEQGEVK